MRLATLLFVLATLAPMASAQDDPPDPWLFYPLAVGNTWEYRHSPDPYANLPRFERRIVERDTVIGGRQYFDHATYTSQNGSAWTLRSRSLLRFDTTGSRVVVRRATGEEALAFCEWGVYGEVACDPSVFPSGGTDRGLVHPVGTQVWVGTSQVSVLARVGIGGVYPFPYEPLWVPYFAAPIGYVGREPEFCMACSSQLLYARVGGVTYGSAIVAAETPGEGAAFALTATPNPATGLLTLTLALPASGVVALEAFDVTGRRVHHAAHALAAGTHALDVDASAWAPGVYVARATAADGAAAIARVVRR